MSGTGYNTASRNRIIEYLRGNRERTVNVTDIHSALRDSGNDVNISTVYRFLEKLTEEGHVMKYVAENGSRAVYQYVDSSHHCEEHLHLQCIKCGAIIHLDCGFMDEISNHILQEHGFHIQCKNSIVYGLCENCFSEGE
ncbi:MAG: Fur family transcriptional regulator [Sphaerochaeta sp.]